MFVLGADKKTEISNTQPSTCNIHVEESFILRLASICLRCSRVFLVVHQLLLALFSAASLQHHDNRTRNFLAFFRLRDFNEDKKKRQLQVLRTMECLKYFRLEVDKIASPRERHSSWASCDDDVEVLHSVLKLRSFTP